jgi:Domain of unknown function (DUF4158)
VKQHWSLDELIDHWTLTPQELVLLEEKIAETNLLLAVPLKAFPLEGCFPSSFESIPLLVADFIARQLELPTLLWLREIWNSLSGSRLRVTVRKHHGFRLYATHDVQPTLNWLQSHVLPRSGDSRCHIEPLAYPTSQASQ